MSFSALSSVKSGSSSHCSLSTDALTTFCLCFVLYHILWTHCSPSLVQFCLTGIVLSHIRYVLNSLCYCRISSCHSSIRLRSLVLILSSVLRCGGWLWAEISVHSVPPLVLCLPQLSIYFIIYLPSSYSFMLSGFLAFHNIYNLVHLSGYH